MVRALSKFRKVYVARVRRLCGLSLLWSMSVVGIRGWRQGRVFSALRQPRSPARRDASTGGGQSGQLCQRCHSRSEGNRGDRGDRDRTATTPPSYRDHAVVDEEYHISPARTTCAQTTKIVLPSQDSPSNRHATDSVQTAVDFDAEGLRPHTTQQ